jgi:hypothetical protein
MIEKIKCNPLYCLTVFFAIVAMIFGSIKQDLGQIRQEIAGIYKILIDESPKFSITAPAKQNYSAQSHSPALPVLADSAQEKLPKKGQF